VVDADRVDPVVPARRSEAAPSAAARRQGSLQGRGRTDPNARSGPSRAKRPPPASGPNPPRGRHVPSVRRRRSVKSGPSARSVLIAKNVKSVLIVRSARTGPSARHRPSDLIDPRSGPLRLRPASGRRTAMHPHGAKRPNARRRPGAKARSGPTVMARTVRAVLPVARPIVPTAPRPSAGLRALRLHPMRTGRCSRHHHRLRTRRSRIPRQTSGRVFRAVRRRRMCSSPTARISRTYLPRHNPTARGRRPAVAHRRISSRASPAARWHRTSSPVFPVARFKTPVRRPTP